MAKIESEKKKALYLENCIKKTFWTSNKKQLIKLEKHLIEQ